MDHRRCVLVYSWQKQRSRVKKSRLTMYDRGPSFLRLSVCASRNSISGSVRDEKELFFFFGLLVETS